MAIPRRRIFQSGAPRECAARRGSQRTLLDSLYRGVLTVRDLCFQDIVSYGNQHGVSFQYFRVSCTVYGRC